MYLFKYILFSFLIIVCVGDMNAKKNKEKHVNNNIHKYNPDWESLDSRPLPQWYDDAKVGIFLHWGVYTVPNFGSEWFWINWQGYNSSSYIEYMKKNYKPGFTYQEFARDFTAEHFNPKEWVKLFKNSGANYVVLTSKHHEGYTLWPSSYSYSWNSKDVGPHRDIIGELSTEIRKNSKMIFGLYYSLYEWFNPLYVEDKKNNFTTNTFAKNKVIPELKEVINRYHPDVIWSDGDWEASDKYWSSKEFLAWLYNESPVRDTVVTNDRWGKKAWCKHGGFHTCSDRYNPGVLQKHKFENAMTVDRKSWGHRGNAKLEDYLSMEQLVKEIAVTVSCGGNILINVGPDRFGVIEPIFAERLKGMGKWLKINGEAIYKSIPWTYQNDSSTPDVWYTSHKSSQNRQNVYAIVLNYPYDDNGVALYSMNGKLDEKSKVHMLGYSNSLQYYTDVDDTIYVKFPPKQNLDKNGLAWGWTLKIDVPV